MPTPQSRQPGRIEALSPQSEVVTISGTAGQRRLINFSRGVQAFEVLDGGRCPHGTRILIGGALGGASEDPLGAQGFGAIAGTKGLGPFDSLVVYFTQTSAVRLRIFYTRSVAVGDQDGGGFVRKKALFVTDNDGVTFPSSAGTQLLTGLLAVNESRRMGLDRLSLDVPLLDEPASLEVARYWSGIVSANVFFALYCLWAPEASTDPADYEVVQTWQSIQAQVSAVTGVTGTPSGYTGPRYHIDLSRQACVTAPVRVFTDSPGTHVYQDLLYHLAPIPEGSVKLALGWDDGSSSITFKAAIYGIAG